MIHKLKKNQACNCSYCLRENVKTRGVYRNYAFEHIACEKHLYKLKQDDSIIYDELTNADLSEAEYSLIDKIGGR